MAHLQEGELWQHAHQVWGAGSWALRTQLSVEDVGGPAGSMLRSTPPPQSQSLVWECRVNGRMTASSALGTPPHLRAPPRRCLSSRERLLLSTPTRSLGRTHVTPDPQHPIYLQEWGGCSSSSTPEQVVSTAGWLHHVVPLEMQCRLHPACVILPSGRNCLPQYWKESPISGPGLDEDEAT